MKSLIHHFKVSSFPLPLILSIDQGYCSFWVFSEGFSVPSGETYSAIEAPKGNMGLFGFVNIFAKPTSPALID